MSNASDTGDQPGATTHFGFRDVPEGEKAGAPKMDAGSTLGPTLSPSGLRARRTPSPHTSATSSFSSSKSCWG